MMGGSRMRKNMVGEKLSTLLMLSFGRRRMKMPVMAPRNTMANDSGR